MAGLKHMYLILSVTGFLLSAYTVYVEHRKMEDDSYYAYCDINEKISCSAVVTSEYSIGFGLVEVVFGKENILNQPNAYYGVMAYLVQILLGLSSSRGMTLLKLVINSCICCVSLYLLYILFIIMDKICLVCMATHAVNFGLLVCTLIALKTPSRQKKD